MVLLNIDVWAVEQVIDIDFEFLCVSYIVTEVFMLLLYGVLRDYGIVQPGGSLVSVQMLTQLYTRQIEPAKLPPNMEEAGRFCGYGHPYGGQCEPRRTLRGL